MFSLPIVRNETVDWLDNVLLPTELTINTAPQSLIEYFKNFKYLILLLKTEDEMHWVLVRLDLHHSGLLCVIFCIFLEIWVGGVILKESITMMAMTTLRFVKRI